VAVQSNPNPLPAAGNTAPKTGGLRPFTEADIPAVADLIWKVLHGRQTPAPSSLHTHLNDLFLCNPWLDEGIVSRTFSDSQGKIMGFFGAVPRRMSVQGKTVRLAFGSNFVVDPESRTSMMAIQLVRAFMKGSQDISITDSANDMSRPLLRSLGFTVAPIYSLQWARPLRPLRYGLNVVSRMKKSGMVNMLAGLAKPFCGAADAVAARAGISPLRLKPVRSEDQELDTATLLDCLNKIPAKHWLRPEYDQQSLDWLFDFIAKRNVLGELRKALVRDDSGKTLGWYIYAMSGLPVGEVLQIGADSASAGTVLDHMFYDAWQRGLAGLHGRMEPQFMAELTARGCVVFRHGSWTLVHSSQQDLLNLLHSGTAFFSRLDGEWSFRHGGVER
jgi:hypothetical protein